MQISRKKKEYHNVINSLAALYNKIMILCCLSQRKLLLSEINKETFCKTY